MQEGIDVGADVIQHRNVIGLECHCVARHAEARRLGAFMAQMDGDHRPLKHLVGRHVVFDKKAKIDYALSHGHSLGWW